MLSKERNDGVLIKIRINQRVRGIKEAKHEARRPNKPTIYRNPYSWFPC